MASDGPKKKAHKERLSTCSYCPMTFKKLEHAQRHERTHTLDRPYSCDTCGKTFARQDTLHRHTRLHSRTEDEGPAGKGPKKRRASTSTSAKPSTSNAPKSPKPSSSSSSGSSSSKPIATNSSNKINPKQDEPFSSSSSAFGLSMSLPVHPPSFPAYSQPETFLSHNSTNHNADFPSIGNSNSIDPSVLPLYSRLGDVTTNSNYGNRIPTRRASHGGGTTQVLISSAIGGGGGIGGSSTIANGGGGGMSRPRALTLAGLPESFGCFSLINSPASSTASLSPDEEDDDDDDEYRDSSMEEDTIAEEKQDPTWTIDSPSFPPAPESHYPSPAFSSYSPSALHNDSLTDLQAILDNDPVPSKSFGSKSQSRRRRASHQVSSGTQLAAVPEPDFDFEAFAASIEGAAPPSSNGLAPATMPPPHHRSMSYDEILMSQKNGGGNLFDRYPTPPTDTIPTLPLPTSTDNEFEWLHQYTANAEAQQQAREDAAATAAMFSRGFGLDPTQTTSPSSSSSSALGLNLGLPSPPLTAMAMHAHTVATSTSSSPHFSLPISTSSAPPAQGVFSNLAQTYASTYPTFSLSAPNASIVPTPLQSALASHSSISIATTEPGTDSSTTSPSLHDLLAAAWERRQRQPSQTSSSSQILPASINLKSPFSSSSQPQAKQTPAFYIPSAMHSSAAQIGTATNVDSQAMTVSASGPLSLPIPTWAN